MKETFPSPPFPNFSLSPLFCQNPLQLAKSHPGTDFLSNLLHLFTHSYSLLIPPNAPFATNGLETTGSGTTELIHAAPATTAFVLFLSETHRGGHFHLHPAKRHWILSEVTGPIPNSQAVKPSLCHLYVCVHRFHANDLVIFIWE